SSSRFGAAIPPPPHPPFGHPLPQWGRGRGSHANRIKVARVLMNLVQPQGDCLNFSQRLTWRVCKIAAGNGANCKDGEVKEAAIPAETRPFSSGMVDFDEFRKAVLAEFRVAGDVEFAAIKQGVG